MNEEIKLKICKERLEGKSIYEISKVVGLKPQSVWSFMRKFPYEKNGKIKNNLSKEDILKICKMYIQGYSVKEICNITKNNNNYINNCFSYIVERKPIYINNSVYPKLSEWMIINKYTMKIMAKELNITSVKLSEILSGKRYMEYKIAKKIKNITGLTFKEIFTDFYKVEFFS